MTVHHSTMRITILFFAHLRDLAPCDHATIDLLPGASIQEALDETFRAYPALEPMRGRIAVAMDDRYQPLVSLLHHDCTIALIPPVSGG